MQFLPLAYFVSKFILVYKYQRVSSRHNYFTLFLFWYLMLRKFILSFQCNNFKISYENFAFNQRHVMLFYCNFEQHPLI